MVDTSIDAVFAQFAEENPKIEKMFSQFVQELQEVGIVRIRPEEIVYRIRWELIVKSGDYDVADKLKRQFGNRYAILMIQADASKQAFFELIIAQDWGPVDVSR